MMIVNEMEKIKVVPTEVRYIAKKIKGKAMTDNVMLRLGSHHNID
jgi:hypothetical protein